ncbi:uncharacterized protein LOC127009752 [Eriocheir sinensis]|uniref:uncharacterized protein LOC127009752 n=1 Tax=Eriocheir sinensis TaxID=95602 RepID=UPI0021CA40C2|nr:uncharacterized protein LOC127009752 [Eriocheir sinensis]
MWKVRVQVRDGQALRSGDHHPAPPHSHSRRPRHTERKIQRERTLDSRKGETGKTGKEEREKGKEKKQQHVEFFKETPTRFFRKLQSEPEESLNELQQLKKTASSTENGDVGTEGLTKRLHTSRLHQMIEAARKNVPPSQKVESSQTESFFNWPEMKVWKTQKNPHAKALIPFLGEGFVKDQLQETKLRYSGSQKYSPGPNRHTAKETKTVKPLFNKIQTNLSHPNTLGILRKTGRSLKSRKSRQPKRLRSAGMGSLAESSSDVSGVRYKHNFSVSVAEIGKGGVPQQTYLAAEDSEAFVTKNFVVKEVCVHNDKAFSICSKGAENVSSETNAAPTYNVVRKVELALNTEEKDALGLWKTENSTPSIRPKGLHHASRRESKQKGKSSYAKEAASSHLCLEGSCMKEVTLLPNEITGNRKIYSPAGYEQTEKNRKPNTKLKKTSLKTTLKNDKHPKRRMRRGNEGPYSLNVTPSIRERREAARYKQQGRKSSHRSKTYNPMGNLDTGVGGGGGGGGCGDVFGGELHDYNVSRTNGGGPGWVHRGRVHLVETVVTLLVKDINDNPPVFPNTTMFGEVQENGPIGEYDFFMFTCLNSATDFLDILKSNNSRGIIASLDVESLFTNVPVERTINYIAQRVYHDDSTPPLDIPELNKFITMSNINSETIKINKVSGEYGMGYCYGTVKTHKPGNKLRPIISQIPTPTYNIAKKLCKILTPYVPTTYSLNSATDFLDILKSNNSRGIIASLDVESLFTNVPVERTINYIAQRVYHDDSTPPLDIPEAALRGLLQCCTKEAPFTCPRGQKYQQIDGVAMGSPLGVLLSNFFMGCIEDEVFKTINKPDIYCRYIDDIFIKTKNEEDMEDIRTCLQEISGLKFTIERSAEGKMPFLDRMAWNVTKKNQGAGLDGDVI